MKAKIRNALVTWNNPPTKDWDDLVAMLNPAYMVGQLERGEAGTLHWQFAVQWQNPRSFAAIKKDLPLAHFEEVRSWAAAVTYCQKADTRDSGPWEFGTRPTGGSGKAQAEDWETWYQLAAEGKFKEIPAKIQIKHLGNLERIHRQNLKFIDQTDVRGVWIWGAQESARATLPAKCWEPRVTTLSSTISGGTAIRARRSSSWRTLTRKRSSSFTTTSRFGRTAGGSLARPRGRGCPHSPMAGSNFQLQHHGHPQGPRGPPAQEAITRRFMRFEMLSRDEIKNWDTYETVTPEAVAAIFK